MGPGMKPAVLARPGIHQQRAPSQRAAPCSSGLVLQDSWGLERKPGGGCLLLRTLPVEGEANLFLETLSGAGEGTALSRTRVSRCGPQKLQSPSGVLAWKEGKFL